MGVAASSDKFYLERVTPSEVREYVNTIGGKGIYSEYASIIELNGIGGAFLLHTDANEIKELLVHIGISNKLHQQVLVAELIKLRRMSVDGAALSSPGALSNPSSPSSVFAFGATTEGALGSMGDLDPDLELDAPAEPPLLYRTGSTIKALECSICLEPMHQPVTPGCGHSGCKGCLESWMNTKNECPCCKFKITKGAVTALRVNVSLNDLIAKAYPALEAERAKLREESVKSQLLAKARALDRDGKTQLHHSCQRGDLREAEALVAHGAVVDARDSRGETPLRAACLLGRLRLVEFLLSKGADPAARNEMHKTPLTAACMGGHADVVRVLINTGRVNVRDATIGGFTPLSIATCNNRLEVVRALVHAGAEVNTTDDHGNTPLSEARKYNFVEMARLLVDLGAR